MPDPKRPKVRRGRDVKKRLRSYLLQVGIDVWFRMRRVDFPSLFFEGLIPTPLLGAVEQFEGLRKKFRQGDEVEALKSLDDETKATFMELLRRAAVCAVMEPALTFSKKAANADPDLLWVGGMSDDPNDPPELRNRDHIGDVPTPILMTLWRALLGEAGLVVMEDGEALEFRPDESSGDDPALRPVDGLRTEAVVVDHVVEASTDDAPADAQTFEPPKIEFVGSA